MKIAKRLKTGPKPSKIVAARVRRAKRLAKQGYAYRVIGVLLGVSTSRAHQMVTR